MLRFILPSLLCGILFSPISSAEILTVKNIKDLIHKGEAGEQIAAVYADGVTAGLISMASLQRTETGVLTEFCGYFDAHEKGRPLPNPALHVKALVSAWERKGRNMDDLFVDLMINYMSAQYGCK